MHICTDFVNLSLGSNKSINSKIDEVLTVDLALGEMIASWPPVTRVTLSLILTDPPPASKFASRGISSGAVAAQSVRHSGLLCSSTET